MIYFTVGSPDITFDAQMSIFNFQVQRSFFANYKMKILISKLIVGNTPLGLPFKKTFNNILISSVVLPIHPAKVCIYRYVNLDYWPLKLVLLNPDIPCFANSVDPDQLASEEAN